MNKSKPRTLIKKRVQTSLSQERDGSNRKNKQNSGINFLVNVSSSGTNLNKKIQDEMDRLEDVEKKIRGHKTKAKVICSSAKVPNKNERKLKHMLEEIICTLDPVGKTRKQPKSNQKFRDIEKQDQEKLKKPIQYGIKIDSLTNLKPKKKNAHSKKSSVKKPTSAPKHLPNRNLKLTDSLNFGREVDLHLSMSNIPSPQKKNLDDYYEIVVEKPPENNATYVYDSTTINNLNFSNNQTTKTKNRKADENNGSQKKSEYIERNKKPERKRFYSYLTRGNFTISQHTNQQIPSENRSKIDVKRIESQETKQQENTEDGISENTDEKEVDKEKEMNQSFFPTDLIERSIIAVENVLRTIDSITKDFSGKKGIEEVISKFENRPKFPKFELEDELKLNKSSVKSNKWLVKNDKSEKVVTLKSPIRSFYASEDLIRSNMYQRFEKSSDPLSKAKNSLRNGIIEKQHTVYVASQHTCNFSSSCSCITVSKSYHKGSFIKDVFYQDFQVETPPYLKKSELFPEYNFEKCLSLLRKKFRDFDKTRKNNFDQSFYQSSIKQENENVGRKTIRLLKNKRESYEICFKNENFQSQTSIESWSIDTNTKKIGYEICFERKRAKSSPEMENKRLFLDFENYN